MYSSSLRAASAASAAFGSFCLSEPEGPYPLRSVSFRPCLALIVPSFPCRIPMLPIIFLACSRSGLPPATPAMATEAGASFTLLIARHKHCELHIVRDFSAGVSAEKRTICHVSSQKKSGRGKKKKKTGKKKKKKKKKKS